MLNKGTFRTTTLAVVFVWLMAFVVLPHFFIFITSFTTADETEFVKFTFTLDNYRRIFSMVYLRVFLHSVLIAGFATFICLLIGYPVAYILSRSKPAHKSILVLLLIIPFWTSSLVRTYSLMILLKTNGVINSLLLWLGVIEMPIEMLYTWFAVMVGLVYSLLPFMVLPLYSILDKLDNKYLEAAQDLGASKWALFSKIIIPLSMPGIIAGCVLVFLPALGMFYITDLLGGAKDLLLGNLIKNQFMVARDWPFGSALSMIFTLTIGLMLIGYFKSSRGAHQEISL